MPLILGTHSIKDTGYNVANSLRFNSGDSPYLTRTISSGSDITKFTFSFWCKRSKLGGDQRIYSNENTTAKQIYIRFNNNNTFTVYHQAGGSDVLSFDTNAVFRDVSTWYHFHFVMDSTQSTESDRFKMHVNGVQITDFNSPVYPSSSEAAAFLNTNEKSNIGFRDGSGGQHFDGYLTEVVLLQGVAEPYTSFGEFDEDSPTIWKPKDVSSLSRGTNGFYLDFEDSSSLGNDQGGSVNLTPNNLAAIDQSTDTCTNNFATLNPLHYAHTTDASDMPLSEGNLKANSSQGGSPYPYVHSTIAFESGKWYAEFKVVSANGSMIGIADGVSGSYFGDRSNDKAYFSDGNLYTGNTSFGSALSDNDILMVAVDLDNSKIYFGINGTWQNSGDPTSGATGTGASSIGTSETGFWHFTVGDSSSPTPTIECNFGSPPYSISSGNADSEGFGNFEYAVPSGYFALCSKNLAEYG